ncbi:PAS domain S-box protein [Alsobacter sp. SYSU M60028]|uniref:Blue-light-activated histidine kinase n=1 Tax=Alsobacter ponti TaxID=2962936 RepID=A0ABT1LA75_9HYPH|nr:HWE histidine kinase domain-containing protein [Alsobacter ponti]MCP8937963.1 PAS domain S-box protein [Alsobacter ponti]
MNSSPTRDGGRPLRSHLMFYGLSIVVPVLVFAGLVFIQFERTEHERLRERVREVATNVAVDIDREFENAMGTLTALASSPALATGDMARFDEQVRSVQQATGLNFVLRDMTGQQVVNTRRPWGSALPRVPLIDMDFKVIATRKPVVSDMIVGAVLNAPVFLVNAPVFRDGQLVYLLNMAFDSNRFVELLRRESTPDGWVVTVADGQMNIVARSRLNERFGGRKVPEVYRSAIESVGVWEATDLEGRPVIGATARLNQARWFVWAAAPRVALTAPLYDTLLLLAIAGAALTGMSLVLAVVLSRRLSKPVRALASQASRMGRDKRVHALDSPVREITEVSRALADAAGALAARRRELREAVTELESLYGTAPMGIALLDRSGVALRINRWLAEVNGGSVEELLGRPIWDVSPALRPVIEPLVARVFATGEAVQNVELSGVTRTRPGELRHFVAHCYPAKTQEGAVEAAGVIVEDVTDRRRAEASARESDARLRRLLEANLFGMVTISGDRVDTANEAFLAMVGATAEDVAAGRLDWRAMTPPEYAAADEKALEELRESGASRPFEKELIRPDGKRVPILIGAARLDRPDHAICFVVDQTERREREAHQFYLMRELTHRTKNILSVVQSMALQTARNLPNLDEFHRRFAARLQGLAGSHDLLVQQDWTGASINDLVRSQLGHWADAIGSQIEVGGPLLLLTPEAAQNIGMALHELSTNAAKYGALSIPSGRVRISWAIEKRPDGDRLVMHWTERDGPPVTKPDREGFGHVVMARIVARALDGTVDLDFAPDGLRWTLEVPARFARPFGPVEPSAAEARPSPGAAAAGG